MPTENLSGQKIVDVGGSLPAAASFAHCLVRLTSGALYYSNGSAWQAIPGAGGGSSLQTPSAFFGDGEAAASLGAGQKAFLRLPYTGSIVKWHIVADVSCSCVIDIWKAANAVPVLANSIVASAKPALASQATASSSTLTGWSPGLSADDVLAFVLESVTGTPKQISISLEVS